MSASCPTCGHEYPSQKELGAALDLVTFAQQYRSFEDHVLDAHRDGLSQRQISRTLGVPLSRVRAIICPEIEQEEPTDNDPHGLVALSNEGTAA